MRAGFGALAVYGAVPAAGTYLYWLRNTFASSSCICSCCYGWDIRRFYRIPPCTDVPKSNLGPPEREEHARTYIRSYVGIKNKCARRVSE